MRHVWLKQPATDADCVVLSCTDKFNAVDAAKCHSMIDAIRDIARQPNVQAQFTGFGAQE